MHVLDLGSGSGQPAFTAAQFVSPKGSVTATDLSPAMVDALLRRASSTGVTNLRVQVMDMEKLDFPGESFDAVTCRWGFMWPPDKEETSRLKRGLSTGARAAPSSAYRPAVRAAREKHLCHGADRSRQGRIGRRTTGVSTSYREWPGYGQAQRARLVSSHTRLVMKQVL